MGASLRTAIAALCAALGVAMAVAPPIAAAVINVWMLGTGLALVISGFMLAYFRDQQFDVLSPIVGLPVLVLLYSLAGALLAEAAGGVDGGFRSSETVATYYLACSLGIFFLVSGILAGRHRRVDSDTPILSPRYFRPALWIAAVLVGAATLPWWGPTFDPTNATIYVERSLSLRVERMSDASSGLSEVFLVQVPTAIILALSTRTLFASANMYLRLAAAIVLLDFFLVQLLSGWRGAFVYGASLVLCFYHYRMKRLKFSHAVAAAVAAYVVVNGIAIARVSNEPRQMIEQVTSTLGEQGVAALGLASSGEFVASANFFDLIDAINAKEMDYQWGQGWLNELLVFIPRYFLEDRPSTMSEQFVLTFHPGVLESGGGYGFFIIQEGYWQLGLLGVCLTMFLYGYCVERIYGRVIVKRGSEAHVLAYGLLYSALILGAPRSGALLSFKVACINLIGIAIVWAIASFISKTVKGTRPAKSAQ